MKRVWFHRVSIGVESFLLSIKPLETFDKITNLKIIYLIKDVISGKET